MLALHPDAHLVGIDSSTEMLRGARHKLRHHNVTLVHQDLSDPLPEGYFDLIVLALAIHHLEGAQKRTLLSRVAHALMPHGLFVMGDVIVPDDPADVLIDNEPGYDFPSSMDDLVLWLGNAGLAAKVLWLRQDLAIVTAQGPQKGPSEPQRC
ncbi:MAG: class I SAM-dependent methyltransferase [Actinobacteria bacterium]|nr:class I SAM-dependent methyltransferase [Actinomycetota bacterium]